MNTLESHFGLTSAPFPMVPAAADAFCGPQVAAVSAAARKALATGDAAMCLTGPVGSGKSTVAMRALASLGLAHAIIRVGRINLQRDEILELLLREMGLKQVPAGTIHKMTVFRQLLGNFHAKQVRVFFLVEDAFRVGPNALNELESVTAADAGPGHGCGLILMAAEPLGEFLKSPGLARLRQRVRARVELQPYAADEFRAYIRHQVRVAGGDAGTIFDSGAIDVLRQCCDGLPRLANSIALSALDSAAVAGAASVSADIVLEVAADVHGVDTRRISKPAAAEVVTRDFGDPERAATPEPVGDVIEDETSEPEFEPADGMIDESAVANMADEPSPEAPAAADADEEPAGEDDTSDFEVPDMIQDTLPDLEILAPKLAVDARPLPEGIVGQRNSPAPAPSEPVAVDTDPGKPVVDSDSDEADSSDELPTLFSSQALELALAGESVEDDSGEGIQDEVPQPAVADNGPDATAAADAESTLAELRPDLEALEQAMALAKGDQSGGDPAEAAQLLMEQSEAEQSEAGQSEAELPILELADDDSQPATDPAAPADVPQITLDDAIQRNIDAATEALRATQSLEGAGPEHDGPPVTTMAQDSSTAGPLSARDTRADEQLDRIASELARAKTLDEVDDKLAETLFGEEFSAAAAAVVAAAAADPRFQVANDDTGQAETGHAGPSDAIDTDTDSDTDTDTGENETRTSSGVDEISPMEREFEKTYGVDAEAIALHSNGHAGLDPAASQRLATVRALAERHADGIVDDSAATATGTEPSAAPIPIEEQITTSLTQTRKALNVAEFEEAEAQKSKGGFFSRFRRG